MSVCQPHTHSIYKNVLSTHRHRMFVGQPCQPTDIECLCVNHTHSIYRMFVGQPCQPTDTECLCVNHTQSIYRMFVGQPCQPTDIECLSVNHTHSIYRMFVGQPCQPTDIECLCVNHTHSIYINVLSTHRHSIASTTHTHTYRMSVCQPHTVNSGRWHVSSD